jgi:hypothetical protein
MMALSGMSYKGNIQWILSGSNKGTTNCHSFNFVPDLDAQGIGRCEIINSDLWLPSMFVTRLTDSLSQFFVESTYFDSSYFKIIPALLYGNTNPASRVSDDWSSCLLLHSSQTYYLALFFRICQTAVEH